MEITRVSLWKKVEKLIKLKIYYGMDGDLKTLDQLSGSPSDKKFITLDTGSQISGYTKDYLERLCRLGKVECGQWTRGKGQFVVELNSLLRETHTLLISNEGILFVEKKEVTPGENSPAAPAPSSPARLRPTSDGQAQILPQQNFGGQAPLPTPSAPSIPVWNSVRTPPSPPPPPAMTFQVYPAAPRSVPSGGTATGVVPPQADTTGATPLPPIPKEKPLEPVVIPVARGSSTPPRSTSPAYTDEWDKLLFSGASNIPEEPPKTKTPTEVVAPASAQTLPPQNFAGQVYSAVPSHAGTAGVPPPLFTTPSPYRPIQTSVDASEHHDPAPLLPPLERPATTTPPPPPPISTPVVQTPVANSSPLPTPPALPPQPATTPPPPPRPMPQFHVPVVTNTMQSSAPQFPAVAAITKAAHISPPPTVVSQPIPKATTPFAPQAPRVVPPPQAIIDSFAKDILGQK